MAAQPSAPLSVLSARLPQARVCDDSHVVVHGITHDSRQVKAGDLFVCLVGAAHDGHRHARHALATGAAALLAEEGGLARAGVNVAAGTPVVTVPDTRKALPLAACALYGDASHRLIMVGVTGTNGKTTTTRMIASILRASGRKVGTIGTLGAEIDGRPIASEHTTPEADQLQALLAEMVESGAGAVVMEVSSHALAQHRTDGIAFSAGVFTNLTQDHLDFHETMDAYFSANARLFADYPARWPRPDGTEFVAAINASAWEGRYLATLCRGEVTTFTLGEDDAQLRADQVRARPDSTEFVAVHGSGAAEFRVPIRLPVGGAFQVGNALAAIAACLGLGIAWNHIARGLEELAPVPGRFESVPTGEQGFSVVVDYAHTPDGLENLLRSARELEPRRILLVFGCGGNRDRAKRPLMGGLAARLADVAVVTSDNPRDEDPGAIIGEILAGMSEGAGAETHVEPDRRKAIHLALASARAGDIVLIAGKGHEDYQIIGDRTLPFDDRQVVREWLVGRAR
jgi:UDP-N-acetylmuramoyl-L-alanyl-D-glutamate--2,6-diaminopimelate ligase